jgi:hypothetical protein
LTIAANRIALFGRVHRRLRLLDHRDHVEFKQYLEDLCKDLSGLLCEDGAGTDIVVEGMKVHLPSTFAIPLGLITNELITNSVKYAKGCIIVRPGIMVEGRDLASHFPVLKPVAAELSSAAADNTPQHHPWEQNNEYFLHHRSRRRCRFGCGLSRIASLNNHPVFGPGGGRHDGERQRTCAMLRTDIRRWRDAPMEPPARRKFGQEVINFAQRRIS